MKKKTPAKKAPGGVRGLVIVESPAKSRTISRFLGDRYEVTATMGHVRDLPAKKFGVDPDKGFAPVYEVMAGKEKTVRQLRQAAARHANLYLATDEDREGEAIAWHACHLLKRDPGEVKRVVFHEITAGAIERAFRAPRKISEKMVNAQQARRILDRIVGYTLSPLLGRKVQRGLSAGRVQSAALRMLVDREREIEAFKPEKYYLIKAQLAAAGEPGRPFGAVLSGRAGKKFPRPGIRERAEAEKALAFLKANPLRVGTVKNEEKKENPAPPFTTSTLQQEAGRRFGFSASRTMALAQQLYEGVELGAQGPTGLITYHRTDSLSIAAAARTEAAVFIGEAYGREYLPQKPPLYKTKSRNAQEAHEAIRPTRAPLTPEKAATHLNEAQLKLYTLIWSRFLASQAAPARLAVTRARINCGEYFFDVEGRALLFDGYRRIAGNPGREEALPRLVNGEAVTGRDFALEAKETEPPPRYTEATLIKGMEKIGIGRPSTYAPTIDTLLARSYVEREKRTLFPTRLGCLVNDLLVEHFAGVVDLKFTAQMEKTLDEIARGNEDWQQALEHFYKPFQDAVRNAEKALASTPISAGETCPECGRELLMRRGKFGPFWGCSGYPECPYTRNLSEKPGRERRTPGAGAPAAVSTETCPECGGPLYIRRSRYGRFLGCGNFPKCKFTRDLNPGRRRGKAPSGPAAGTPGSGETPAAPGPEKN